MTLARRQFLGLAGATLGLEAVADTPQEFEAILRVALPKWARVTAWTKMQDFD